MRADKKLKNALTRPRWAEVIEALAKGANPNTKAANGLYALAMACWYLEVDVVRELLARGANPNIAKGAPLKSLVTTTNHDQHDVPEVVRLLIDNGVDLDVRYPQHDHATAVPSRSRLDTRCLRRSW